MKNHNLKVKNMHVMNAEQRYQVDVILFGKERTDNFYYSVSQGKRARMPNAPCRWVNAPDWANEIRVTLDRNTIVAVAFCESDKNGQLSGKVNWWSLSDGNEGIAIAAEPASLLDSHIIDFRYLKLTEQAHAGADPSFLNSDQLRDLLTKNDASVKRLLEENTLIRSILAQRGFSIIEPVKRSAPMAGIEISQRYILDDDPAQLTQDELKAGGWWLEAATNIDVIEISNKGIDVYFKSKWPVQGYPHAVMDRSGSITPCKKKPDGAKQIHRVGNKFYWGAPK